MKTENINLYDSVIAFDKISNANLYHVSVTHAYGVSQEAISVFSDCVRYMCELWSVNSMGDAISTFSVVSYISPHFFEKMLTHQFEIRKSSFLYNIIF